MAFGNIEVANEKTRAVSFAAAIFTRLDTNKVFSKTLCIIHSATWVAVFVRKKKYVSHRPDESVTRFTPYSPEGVVRTLRGKSLD